MLYCPCCCHIRFCLFFFSSRRRHTRFALVTGVQTCALPILTVAQSTVLRQQMRDAGADFRVTKNRLAKIALDGTSYTGIGELLTGPTALATSTDPVSAAKIAVEFAKTNDKLEIVGGGMGDVVLRSEERRVGKGGVRTV